MEAVPQATQATEAAAAIARSAAPTPRAAAAAAEKAAAVRERGTSGANCEAGKAIGGGARRRPRRRARHGGRQGDREPRGQRADAAEARPRVRPSSPRKCAPSPRSAALAEARTAAVLARGLRRHRA